MGILWENDIKSQSKLVGKKCFRVDWTTLNTWGIQSFDILIVDTKVKGLFGVVPSEWNDVANK